jgi:hypothetical protein
MLKQYKDIYSVVDLRTELNTVFNYNSFLESHHKHSISLLTEDITPDTHKNFHNNLPYSRQRLENFSSFYSIWKMFSSLNDVTCFRIMEKKPNTAYGLHTDTDAGDIFRFQLPLQTNEKCWLALTPYSSIEEGWTPDNSYFKKDLEDRFGNNVLFYKLREGIIYHFDVTKVHTLTNEGNTDRYTLLIDVKKNDDVLNFIHNSFIDCNTI